MTDTAQQNEKAIDRAAELLNKVSAATQFISGSDVMRALKVIVEFEQQARREALQEARKVCDEHKISLSGNEPNYCRHHNCSREIADALDRLREGVEGI